MHQSGTVMDVSCCKRPTSGPMFWTRPISMDLTSMPSRSGRNPSNFWYHGWAAIPDDDGCLGRNGRHIPMLSCRLVAEGVNVGTQASRYAGNRYSCAGRKRADCMGGRAPGSRSSLSRSRHPSPWPMLHDTPHQLTVGSMPGTGPWIARASVRRTYVHSTLTATYCMGSHIVLLKSICIRTAELHFLWGGRREVRSQHLALSLGISTP
jgi:hypothetical protein